MFNPLHPFELRFIELFKNKGIKAFVKQTYHRGKQDNLEGYVFIHFEKTLAAQQYFDVLKNDLNRELLIVEKKEDTERLKQLLNTSKAFTMLKVKDAEMKARRVLDKKIRTFIEHKMKWNPSREDEVIFLLDVQFGEVYAKLKFRSQEISVKLEEIEKGNYVL